MGSITLPSLLNSRQKGCIVIAVAQVPCARACLRLALKRWDQKTWTSESPMERKAEQAHLLAALVQVSAYALGGTTGSELPSLSCKQN